jgi:hypothetical protein
MTIEARNFTHYAGDTLTIRVTTKYADGSIVDLTGSNLEWVLAKSVSDSPDISKSTSSGGIVVSDAEAGRFEIKLDPVDTESLSGSYYHEAELTKSNGDTVTILVGNITVRPSAI